MSNIDYANGMLFENAINRINSQAQANDIVENANRVIAKCNERIETGNKLLAKTREDLSKANARINRSEDELDRLSSERNAAIRLSNKIMDERIREVEQGIKSPMLDPAKTYLRKKQLEIYEEEEKEKAAKEIYGKPELK